MKFFLPVALLVAAVSAQSSTECDAANIVEACLSGERTKFENCAINDYDCQCAASQAIATCYNNCPGDVRKPGADGDIQIYCGQASVFGSKATAAATPTGGSSSDDSGSADATPTSDSEDSSSGTDSSDGAEETGSGEKGAAAAVRAGSMLLAVAGAVAVVV